LTTGVGTDTTGCACVKNAHFLLEKVAAAFGCERFRPCMIRAIVLLYTLFLMTAMMYYATTLFFFTLEIHANDLISQQRDLDDFVNVIGTVQHHEHVFYVSSGYRCVILHIS
jgi:hypothetical protein